MTLDLYTASYAHRYSDPCGAYIGTDAAAVEDAIIAAMQYEDRDLASYCEHDGPFETDENGVTRCTDDCADCEGACAFCHSDLVWYGVHRVGHVSDFARSLAEAKSIIRDIRDHPDHVIALDTN